MYKVFKTVYITLSQLTSTTCKYVSLKKKKLVIQIKNLTKYSYYTNKWIKKYYQSKKIDCYKDYRLLSRVQKLNIDCRR